MSNNIYDILKKFNSLDSVKNMLSEGKKVCKDCGKAKCECVNESKGSKPDYIDLDKDGDTNEPMKKAAKDKSKGAIAEAVARVEQNLAEKYQGFKKTVDAIKKSGSADNPEAVAASIGRKKYGKDKFQKAAAAGKKLGEGEYNEDLFGTEASRKFAICTPDGEILKELENVTVQQAMEVARKMSAKYSDDYDELLLIRSDLNGEYDDSQEIPFSKEVNEASTVDFEKVLNAIAALYGDDIWDNDAMQDLADDLEQAGPTDKELDFIIAKGKLPKRLAGIQFSAGDNVRFGEGSYNEDMLSPGQKKIARMSPPPNKIDAMILLHYVQVKRKKLKVMLLAAQLQKPKPLAKTNSK
jgi:hypothetical protein